jgi:hypothetical protein
MTRWSVSHWLRQGDQARPTPYSHKGRSAGHSRRSGTARTGESTREVHFQEWAVAEGLAAGSSGHVIRLFTVRCLSRKHA